MNLARLFSIFIFLVSVCLTSSMLAQSIGGRKKERRNQHGNSVFHRKRSAGNADAFARGGRKKGLFARIFSKKSQNGPWVYRPTATSLKQKKEQPQLFHRNRTNAKRGRDKMLFNQNKKRVSHRVRGSSAFSKRKH
jgi:hypothetical protein